jgi:hypothetical protein
MDTPYMLRNFIQYQDGCTGKEIKNKQSKILLSSILYNKQCDFCNQNKPSCKSILININDDILSLELIWFRIQTCSACITMDNMVETYEKVSSVTDTFTHFERFFKHIVKLYTDEMYDEVEMNIFIEN